MIKQDKNNLQNKIINFRDLKTGDTCLHIAAKASNRKLV
jgi:hypothetical protein